MTYLHTYPKNTNNKKNTIFYYFGENPFFLKWTKIRWGFLSPLVAIVGIISAILSGKWRPWGWSSKRPKPFLAWCHNTRMTASPNFTTKKGGHDYQPCSSQLMSWAESNQYGYDEGLSQAYQWHTLSLVLALNKNSPLLQILVPSCVEDLLKVESLQKWISSTSNLF